MAIAYDAAALQEVARQRAVVNRGHRIYRDKRYRLRAAIGRLFGFIACF